MKTFLIYAMLASTVSAISLRDVPTIREISYTPSVRDPFVDASVTSTLLGATGDRDISKVGPSIESYRGELEALLRQSNKVDGVAIANGMGYSVVNGKIVKREMTLSVPISDDLCERLLLTSRYFGLGLENQVKAKQLQFRISQVTPTGLRLHLQGMTTDLHLPYRKNLSPQ